MDPRRALNVSAVLVVALGVGGCGAGDDDDGGERVRLPPASSSAPAATGPLVDVGGAVVRPGVYRLRDGSRVLHALRAAGGARPGADLAALNRAAPVVDGQQVIVPLRSAGVAGAALGNTGGGEDDPQGAAVARISINAADAAALDELPGIGPVTAEHIVADRNANGPFASVDDLDRVPGVGPATVEALREVATP